MAKIRIEYVRLRRGGDNGDFDAQVIALNVGAAEILTVGAVSVASAAAPQMPDRNFYSGVYAKIIGLSGAAFVEVGTDLVADPVGGNMATVGQPIYLEIGAGQKVYAIDAGANAPGPTYAGTPAFDVSVVPVVSTAPAYTAGDIMGGLLEFDVGLDFGDTVLIQEIALVFRSAVQPNCRLILLGGDPVNTTKTDNAAYNLVAADAFLVRKPIVLSGWTSHGTPKSLALGGLALPYTCAPDSKKIRALLIDDTGVTLATTSDLQVSIKGLR